MLGMGDTVVGILTAAAIITAVIVIGRAGIWLWHVLRKLAQFADDWIGEQPRDGLPTGRPGVLARLVSIEEAVGALGPMRFQLAAMEERLAAVEKELHPNGGSSLRDAVDRLSVAADQIPVER